MDLSCNEKGEGQSIGRSERGTEFLQLAELIREKKIAVYQSVEKCRR